TPHSTVANEKLLRPNVSLRAREAISSTRHRPDWRLPRRPAGSYYDGLVSYLRALEPHTSGTLLTRGTRATSAAEARCVLRDAPPVQAWGRLFGRSLRP